MRLLAYLPLVCILSLSAAAWADEHDPRCTGSPVDSQAVAVGDGCYLALRADGSIWSSTGPNDSLREPGHIAVGACIGVAWALRGDGSAISWVLGGDRARPVRRAAGPFVSLACAGHQAYAIAADGTVTMLAGTLAPPGDLGPVSRLALAPDDRIVMAVMPNGQVRSWSGSDHLAPPDGLSDVVQVSIGSEHALARHADGHVTGWGSDDLGQANPPVDLPPTAWIAAGAYHSVAVLTTGQVAVWGGSYYGTYSAPSGLIDAAEVSCSLSWTAIRRTDGSVLLTNGSPGGSPWSIMSWTYEGQDAGLIVLTEDITAEDRLIPLEHSEPLDGITIDPHVVVPGGQRFASNRISTAYTASGADRLARVVPGPRPDPDSFDWYRGVFIKVVDLAPTVRLAFSPTGTIAMAAWGDRSFLAIDDVGRPWGLGQAQAFTAVLPPPQSESITSVAHASSMDEASAICSDGRVIASWRSWQTLPDVGAVSLLIPGAPRLAIRPTGELITLEDQTIIATQVAAACQSRSGGQLILRTSGVVELLGDGLAPPDDLGLCRSIACGAGFGAAVRNNGTVVVWQQSTEDPGLVPPPGLGDVVSISAGNSHVLALKSDGSVVAWGRDSGPATEVPPGLADVATVVASEFGSAALRNDGIIVSWPNTSWPGTPVLPSIPEGGRFSAVLTATSVAGEDIAVQWHTSGDGRLAPASPLRIPSGAAIAVVPIDAPADEDDLSATGVLALDTGAGYRLDESGAWISVLVEDLSPVLSAHWSPTQVSEIAAHGDTIACLRVDGSIALWGTDLSSPAISALPMRDHGLHGLALTTDRLLGITAAGSVTTVPLEPGSGTLTAPPTDLAPVAELATSGRHVLARLQNGQVRAWGDLTWAEPPAGLSGIIRVATVASASLALRDDGSIVAWGAGHIPWTTVPADLPPAVDIACGISHAVAVLADGTVRAWGDDDQGQLMVPAGLSGVTAVRCLGTSTYALRDDGSIVAWGSYGGLPAVVPSGLSPFQSLAIGQGLVGLRGDGTIVIWGGFSHNVSRGPVSCREGDRIAVQLRLSKPAPAAITIAPVLLSSPAGSATLAQPGVMAIGDFSAQALVDTTVDPADAADAAVSGRINSIVGLGIPYAAEWPITLPALTIRDRDPAIHLTLSPTGLSTFALGSNTLIGLRPDGRIVAWGSGPLVTPAQGRTGRSVAVGANHALLLDDEGRVTAFGSNAYGQCSVPADLGPVTAIAAGAYFSIALRDDGTVVCWGVGSDWQPMTAPTGLDQVVRLATGGGAGAIRADGSVVTWNYTYAEMPVLRGPVTALHLSSMGCIATLGDGTVQVWNTYELPPDDLQDVVAAVMNQWLGVAMHGDGTCTYWGSHADAARKLETGPVTAITSSSDACAVLRSDGSVCIVSGDHGFEPPVIREGDSIAVRLSTSDPASDSISIGIAWSGPALDGGGVDGPPAISIAAGTRSAWGTYSIRPDDDATDDTLYVQMLRGEGYGPDYAAIYPTSINVLDDGIGTPRMWLSTTPATVTEGALATITLHASRAFTSATTWNIQASGTAEADDLQFTAGPHVLAAGETTLTIPVETKADLDADNETVYLHLDDAPGYQIYPIAIAFQINDPDRLPDAVAVGIRITRPDDSGWSGIRVRRDSSGGVTDGTEMQTRTDGHADVDTTDDPGPDDDPLHFSPQLPGRPQVFSLDSNPAGDG